MRAVGSFDLGDEGGKKSFKRFELENGVSCQGGNTHVGVFESRR